MPEYKGMKVLEIDIETAPAKAYIWSPWKENIPHARVIENGYMLCWAAKWQHKKGIMFRDRRDPDFLDELWDLLDEADAVVHYNGKNFDIKWIQTEFLLGGYMPPSPFRQIDLLPVARQKFKLLRNTLENVVEVLEIGEKLPHAGFDMWIGCMENDAQSWKDMRLYNEHDVRLLQGVYTVFQPWITNHPNRALWLDAVDPTCPNCGGTHMQSRGIERTQTLKYYRYQCADCHTWARARTRIEPADRGVLRRC